MLFTIGGVIYDFSKVVKEFLVINTGCNWKINYQLTIFCIVIINSTSCKSIKSSYSPWILFSNSKFLLNDWFCKFQGFV
jgi:hypothetical protein